jgi:invasion protein IalB
MLKTLKSTTMIVLLGLATQTFAQDTTEEAPAETGTAEAGTEATTPEETPGAETPAPDDLNLGTPVTAPQENAPYVREEFADWSLRCVRVAEGPEPCQLYQLLLDADENPVAEIGMFRLPEGGEAIAGANFVAPMETLLPAGVRISVDGGETLSYPYSFCSARGFSPLLSSGCLARIGFTQGMIDAFRRGRQATITIVPALATDQEVVLTLSLSGFTDGFAATGSAPPAQ